MPTETKVPSEIRAWVADRDMHAGEGSFHDESSLASLGRVPVLIRPYDASNPPPEGFEVGAKVQHNGGPNIGKSVVVDSDLFRWGGAWWFVCDNGDLHYCRNFELRPPTATVTLRVTGNADEVAKMRAKPHAYISNVLSVEVVEE